VSSHYLEKIECSSAQLFIHSSQNNVHIRQVRMINFDYVLMWLFRYFVFKKSILKYVFDILVFEILYKEYFAQLWRSQYFIINSNNIYFANEHVAYTVHTAGADATQLFSWVASGILGIKQVGTIRQNRDGNVINGLSFVTHNPRDVTHDPWPLTIASFQWFHPTHGTERGRGIVVLDNPLGLGSKKNRRLKLSLQLW